MDDPRWEPGMPVLDRQTAPASVVPASAVPASASAARPHRVPARVPETAPTPLHRHYVMLSVVVFICGAVAITALEWGVPVSSPIVKVSAVVGAPILIVTTLDAILRIWRSARAWLPVNRDRGLFRLAWLVAALVGLVGLVSGAVLILLA